MVGSGPSGKAWREHASPFDRVWAVVQTVTKPRPVSWIAAEAVVSESTTRTHLERFVEMNILQKFNDLDASTYAPDPLYMRFNLMRELRNSPDLDELISLKDELQTQLETWRDRYGVTSPEELRELAEGMGDAEEIRNIRRTAHDWELAEYRLTVVEDVINRYDQFNAGRTP